VPIIAVSLFYVPYDLFFLYVYCWRIFLGEKKCKIVEFLIGLCNLYSVFAMQTESATNRRNESSFVDTIIVRERQLAHSRKELGGKNANLLRDLAPNDRACFSMNACSRVVQWIRHGFVVGFGQRERHIEGPRWYRHQVFTNGLWSMRRPNRYHQIADSSYLWWCSENPFVRLIDRQMLWNVSLINARTRNSIEKSFAKRNRKFCNVISSNVPCHFFPLRRFFSFSFYNTVMLCYSC